jgi:hypothetical protein
MRKREKKIERERDGTDGKGENHHQTEKDTEKTENKKLAYCTCRRQNTRKEKKTDSNK